MRKEAEDSIGSPQRLLDDILRAASEFSIIATDPSGVITAFNRGSERMLGYTADEIVGKHTPLVFHAEAEVVARSKALTAELGYEVKGFRVFVAKSELQDAETREWTYVRKDGSTLLVSLVVTVMRSENGEVTGYLGIAHDITQQKRNEEEVNRLAAIVRHSSELVNLADLDGRMVFLNETGAKILGIDPEEVAETNIMQVIPGHLKSLVEQEVLPALLAGKSWNGDLQYVNLKTGALTDVYATMFVIDDRQAGHHKYLASLSLDISQRKQTEEKFTKVFMMAPDGISITRMTDGLIIDTSVGFREISGWERSEVIGRTSLDVNFWADPADRTLLVEDIKAGRDVLQREFLFRRKDGTVRNGVYSARSLMLAGELCILFVMQDVTQRTKTERLLREKEERLHGITINMPGIVFRFYATDEGAWGMSYVSERLAEIFELPADPVESIFPSFVSRIHEEDRDGFQASIREAVKTGAPWNYEGRYVKPSGEMIWFQGLSTPSRHEDRTVFDGILLDISEQRRLEDDRRRLERQLYHSQKMDAIGQLASGVAHDFNNILTGIQGNAALLLMECDPEHPHRHRLNQIEEQVRRGANLTRQLLGFARGGKYEVKTVSMNDVIRKTAQFFLEARKEIHADFALQDDIYPVDADAGQIEQVLLNLFINAGHAMPKGGALHIQTTKATLDEEEAESFEISPGDYVKVSVSDTGMGMDKDTLARVFEPFFTTKSQQGGTGLGLASCYGIMRNHGGAIHASSELGHGSTFTLYLPSSVKQIESEEHAPDRTLLTGRGSILLVDDETMILEIAYRFLTTLGYTVCQATSGREAIDIYREMHDNIELVILDMIMPGMSGSQTLEMLKEINPEVRVILSSGYGLQGEVRRVMASGCLAFIQKPYVLSDLSKIVHQSLHSAKSPAPGDRPDRSS